MFSFHVGSGCFDATAFKTAVESAKLVFDWAVSIPHICYRLTVANVVNELVRVSKCVGIISV